MLLYQIDEIVDNALVGDAHDETSALYKINASGRHTTYFAQSLPAQLQQFLLGATLTAHHSNGLQMNTFLFQRCQSLHQYRAEKRPSAQELGSEYFDNHMSWLS